jgi:hypothetical protein
MLIWRLPVLPGKPGGARRSDVALARKHKMVHNAINPDGCSSDECFEQGR